MSNLVGVHVRDLLTPALLVDVTAMERNHERMSAFCARMGVVLRPHAKSHRSPDLARWQIAAGAQGICCGSLAEAETMLRAGIDDILITKQVVQPGQLERVARLAEDANLMLIVDDSATVELLDRCARAAQTRVGVLVDVDLGLGRSGVQPGEPTRQLAHAVANMRGLEFMGLMGYEGSMHDLDQVAREQRCARALGALVATREQIERDGIVVRVVSSGATSTYRTAGAVAGITEIQPGSYLLGDAKYRHTLPEIEPALSVLTTVISRPSARRVTIDAGQKKLTSDAHLPQPKDAGVRMVAVNEEHGLLDMVEGGRDVRVGDTLELIPWHGGTTVNLYDRMYGIRDGRVAEVWEIAARGA